MGLTQQGHDTECNSTCANLCTVLEESQWQKLAETGELPLPNAEEDGEHCERNECSDLWDTVALSVSFLLVEMNRSDNPPPAQRTRHT